MDSQLQAQGAAPGVDARDRHGARSYLIGSMPFHVATARQRMQLAVRDAVFDLPPGFTATLPEALGALTAADVRAACARNLRPDDAVTVAVTTADLAQAGLGAAGAGSIKIVEHDAY